MTKVFLYVNDISPPCRAVLMVAKEVKLDYKIREVNLDNEDHLTEEFLKMNPLHTIPVLEDHGCIIADSHAIAGYMVDEFSNRMALYPKELQKRALVIQCFIFDAAVLFPAVKRAVRPILMGEKNSIAKEDIDACKEAFSQLNKLLEGKRWLLDHETYTVADISCVATASSASVLVDVDQYPNVKAWMKCCEERIPSYRECNLPGLTKFQMYYCG